MLGDTSTVHLDDILLFTTTADEHRRKATRIEELLRNAGLKLNRRKCISMKNAIEYCGHRYENGWSHPLRIDNTISGRPEPWNKTELRRFLRHVNYFRDYMPSLAHFAAPLSST
jgi:hypothetical protein